MHEKEKILRSFLDAWNNRDLETCMRFFTNEIELRSTYAFYLFPESKGVLTGKLIIKIYLQFLFDGMDNIDVAKLNIVDVGDYFIVRGRNDNETLD